MGPNGPEARLPHVCEECGQLVEPVDDRPFEVGGLTLRPGFRTVEREGRQVRLTEQQFRTLAFLVKRGSARKEAIHTVVFERLDGDGPDIKIVDVVICNLRRVLSEIDAGGVIKTIWGRGYAFDPDNLSPAVLTPVMRKAAAAARRG